MRVFINCTPIINAALRSVLEILTIPGAVEVGDNPKEAGLIIVDERGKIPKEASQSCLLISITPVNGLPKHVHRIDASRAVGEILDWIQKINREG